MKVLRFIPGASLLNPWRWVRRIAFFLVAFYVLLIVAVVINGARTDEGNKRVGAIIVLGAAQYNGKPSPVLKRRLDHALMLYKRDQADRIVVTGGRQEGDRSTEASASAAYLMKRGVPDKRIEREVQGKNSYESIAAAARFLKKQDVTSVLFVTDGYHAARVKAIGREVGLTSYASPVGGAGSTSRLVRESLAVGVGELITYRRLAALVG